MRTFVCGLLTALCLITLSACTGVGNRYDQGDGFYVKGNYLKHIGAAEASTILYTGNPEASWSEHSGDINRLGQSFLVDIYPYSEDIMAGVQLMAIDRSAGVTRIPVAKTVAAGQRIGQCRFDGTAAGHYILRGGSGSGAFAALVEIH